MILKVIKTIGIIGFAILLSPLFILITLLNLITDGEVSNSINRIWE